MFRIATSNAAVQNIDGVRRTDGSHAHLHLACRSHRACGDWLRLIADFLAFEHGGPCKGQDPLPARNPPQLQGYEGSSCSRLNERHLAHSIGARRGPDRSAMAKLRAKGGPRPQGWGGGGLGPSSKRASPSPAALQLTAYRNETTASAPAQRPGQAFSAFRSPRRRTTCGLPGGYRRGIASILPWPAAALLGNNVSSDRVDRHLHGIQHFLRQKGLLKKSTAPAFMAMTDIGISPWPMAGHNSTSGVWQKPK
jgi:hypothetical protein